MITVIFIARDEEEPLLRSLAALAPLAAEGLIGDVIVADLFSRDATGAVAEAAGCTLVENCANERAALERAVKLARKEWLLALKPGDTPGAPVAASLRDHIARYAQTRLPLAFLALSTDAGWGKCALLGKLFDVFGFAARDSLRLLVPRGEADLLSKVAGHWRGARSRAPIERAVTLDLRS